MHQRSLYQHVVLEKVELEHELCLGDQCGVTSQAVHGVLVGGGEEGELPLQTADDLGVATELVGSKLVGLRRRLAIGVDVSIGIAAPGRGGRDGQWGRC